MGRILRHIHYMGRYIQFHVTPESEIRTSFARLTAFFSDGYVYPPGKERARYHDFDLKASQVILDGAHEIVG